MPAPFLNSTWTTSIQKLETWLEQQSTAPDIIRIIIENHMAWRSDRRSVPYLGPHPHLRTAQLEQLSIGWENFLRGFVTTTWCEAQHNYFLHLQSKKTGQRWLTALIQKLWAISWDMWRFHNGILHSNSTNTPTNFTFLLSSAILHEINHGHRLLPPSCTYLFSRSSSSLLKGTINSQKLWLATVWSARDLYSPADTICQSRDQVVHAFVQSWKKRIKK